MSSAVLVYQPYVPATQVAAEATGAYLRERGVRCDLLSAHELLDALAPEHGVAVSFGGDGTALRTARWLSEGTVPVVPVRMGKLSFLGEIDPNDLPAAVDPYLAGDYWIDERAMLAVESGEEHLFALNDVVMVRGESPRAVHVEVQVDGASVVTYLADGVVVSTPTGSTAYSLAAGGPVISPRLRALVVTPIAPHLTALRSLVLHPDVNVQLVNRGYAPTVVTIDGQLDQVVETEGAVRVTLADRCSRFARRSARTEFFEGLSAKLSRG